MRAVVTYPYTDRETGEVRYAGDAVELSDARFAELSRTGHVSRAADAEPADEARAEPCPGPEEEGEKAEPGEMTAAQLRAAIESKGGFAPKKATKAQLAEILGTL